MRLLGREVQFLWGWFGFGWGHWRPELRWCNFRWIELGVLEIRIWCKEE